MNDSEQYHTGRAAAYYTMTGVIRALLLRSGGTISRRDLEVLAYQAELWQVKAEEEASKAPTGVEWRATG